MCFYSMSFLREKLCREVTWILESGRQHSFHRKNKKIKSSGITVEGYLELKPFVGNEVVLSWNDQFMAITEGKEDGASAALLGNHSRRYEPLLIQQALPARIRSCQQASITLMSFFSIGRTDHFPQDLCYSLSCMPTF